MSYVEILSTIPNEAWELSTAPTSFGLSFEVTGIIRNVKCSVYAGTSAVGVGFYWELSKGGYTLTSGNLVPEPGENILDIAESLGPGLYEIKNTSGIGSPGLYMYSDVSAFSPYPHTSEKLNILQAIGTLEEGESTSKYYWFFNWNYEYTPASVASNCKVEFIDWQTGDLAHSITEVTGLADFSFSARKMASVSNFAFEPMRLKLTLMLDDWLEAYFLSPGQILDKSISKYKIKFYIGDLVMFTGLVEMSGVSYAKSTGKLNITSHDMLKLFDIYSDLERRYFPYYFELSEIFYMYLDDIRIKLGLNVGLSSDVQMSSVSMGASNKLIYECDFTNIVPRVLDIQSAPQGDLDYLHHYIYFRSYDGVKLIYLAYRPKNKTSGGKVQGIHFFGRVWGIFNNLCLEPLPEYDLDEYVDANGSYDWEDNVKTKFASIYPVYSESGVIGGNSSLSIGSRHYSHSINYGSLDYGFLISPIPIEVYYSGPLPGTYRLNSGNDPYAKEAVLKQLDSLKQILPIRNMSLWCDENGKIILSSKVSTGLSVTVDEKDVYDIECSHDREESIGAERLSSLMGDTKALAEIISERYALEVSNTMRYSLDIIGEYYINLFDLLLIGTMQLKVIELTPLPLKYKHKITARRIYD